MCTVRVGFATLLVCAVITAAGTARADYPDDCAGSITPSADDCGEWEVFGYEGCCDESGRVIWCDFGQFYCIDCSGLNPECGWQGSFYDCGTGGEEEPTGTFPKNCVSCDPPCGPGFKCENDQCVVCVPDCVGKLCGFDGCGGKCGECSGICKNGKCNVGPGCEATYEAGCDGCQCEACVCAEMPDCCDPWWGWDSWCVDVCIDTCGGCFVPPNCGDGACKPEEQEDCQNCWTDCACEESATCYKAECCVPACEGKECGSDGCGGVCGDCPVSRVCKGGTCKPNDGCSVWDQPGCGDCLCEDCVCDIDSSCCSVEWDYACAGICVVECGGCGLPPNCGDGTCFADEKESCTNCPEDCPCGEGEVCFKDECCAPACDGKECGDDGCGGACGTCTAGLFCIEGKCLPNNGCIETYQAGCDGCPCEECVCEIDSGCCDIWWGWGWDSWCIGLCESDCGGCANLENCGDGVCQEGDESCQSCPGDCLCGEGQKCYKGKCCAASCDGIECGDDGCGGDCGECSAGKYCVDGQCQANDGCQETMEVGCGGCQCEQCVCEIDFFCCDPEWGGWDSWCVDECMYDCGGCGVAMPNCGDGVCVESEGEDCTECPDDCSCPEGLTCYQGECCKGDCEGKECGSDGCGGWCASCPCADCLPEETWCDSVTNTCIVSNGLTCKELSLCTSECGDYDYECYDACEAQASQEAVATIEAWADCVVDAGYDSCWDLACIFGVYLECVPALHACLQGTSSCTTIWTCMSECGTDADCAGLCAYEASIEATTQLYSLLECGAIVCGNEFDPDCYEMAAEDLCEDEYDECVNCAPDCTDAECGDDGCGGSCGSCPTGVTCKLGKCDCEPACVDKECGTDGCGGSCGECEKGSECNELGKCEALCFPDCEAKECGPNGCGGECGACGPADECVDGKCKCKPLCEGRDCGPDACDATCGECEDGEHCSPDGKCVSDCKPECEDKECGPDGCGGSCGECGEAEECNGDGSCAGIAESIAEAVGEEVEGETADGPDVAGAGGCGCRMSAPAAAAMRPNRGGGDASSAGTVPAGAARLVFLTAVVYVALRRMRRSYP